MVWIDYRNAYELIPCPWIKKSMETCGVADNISHLLCKNMESWKTILMLGNEELDRVNIQRGIFQGDSLSPLLFVIGLIPLIQTLRKVNAGNTNLKRVSTKRSITVSSRMIWSFMGIVKKKLKDSQVQLETFWRICYRVWYKQVCTCHSESLKTC